MNSKLLIDFYREYGRSPFTCFRTPAQDLESALPNAWEMSPEEALKYIKKKGSNIITSSSWDEMDAKAHHKAFTVAKVASADLLQEIYDHVERAKKEGWTLKQFQNELVPRLESAGWTGIKPGRLTVIYDTNMQMSYAQNKYKQQKLLADQYPYWKYIQVERKTKRHDHAKLNGKIFRHDDPIWQKIYPPSAFGCKCSVIPLKESEVDHVDRGEDINLNDEDFQISPLQAWKPGTTRYVNGIKKQLDKMLEGNTPESGIVLNDIQKRVKDQVIEKLGVEMPDEFYKYFKNDTIIEVGPDPYWAYYEDTSRLIKIDDRIFNNDYMKKTVLSHEGMHAGHMQNNIVTNNQVKSYVSDAYEQVKSHFLNNYNIPDLDDSLANDMWLARANGDKIRAVETSHISDLISAFTNNRYGGGHEREYWESVPNSRYAEFLAHCSEIYFVDNNQIKTKFPVVYEIMKNLATKIIEEL